MRGVIRLECSAVGVGHWWIRDASHDAVQVVPGVHTDSVKADRGSSVEKLVGLVGESGSRDSKVIGELALI